MPASSTCLTAAPWFLKWRCSHAPSKRGFDAQLGQQRVVFDGAAGFGMPQHRAEAPRIVQAQHRLLEDPLDVVMLAQEFAWGDAAQRPRHAQVHDLGAVFEAQQQILAAARALQHGAAADQRGQVGQDGPAHAGFVDDQPRQRPAGDDGVDSSTRGFDFRQFRHEPV